MRTAKKGEGEYIWVRVSFSRADVFYNISNCYARIWVPAGSEFPPGDRFLYLENVVLPLSTEEPKRSARPEGTTLVALKNMPRVFPGAAGSLYVNYFQISSIMPLNPKSSLVQDLKRIIRVTPVEEEKESQEELSDESRIVSLKTFEKPQE